MKLQFAFLDRDFSVIKTEKTQIPPCDFVFFARTDEEISLVCPTECIPEGGVIAREDGWRCFRVCGTLDFSLVGILARITTSLAEAGVGIFAVSTYNTDYVLYKKEQEDTVKKVLKALVVSG